MLFIVVRRSLNYKLYLYRMSIIKNLIIAVCLLVSFTFCRNENLTHDIKAYFEKEIQNRWSVLDTLSVSNDSLKVNTEAVNQQINDYILLSKDIENLTASVNMANAYFLNLSHTYAINENDFTKVSTAMHPNEIAITLKQNELNFFNQLIFKNNAIQLSPYTAQ
jgi:hypothetical protein